MAFRTNENQQMSINDPLYSLTERELKILKGSWAESFANHIFPNIDEKPFSVLYSDNDASKPNTPVNIILGLLMLKDQFGLTDEEVMHQMLFNVQFQYALHTSSFKEQPVNDNTLRRFRNRVCGYEAQTGADLIKEAFKGLTGKISGIMGVDPSLKRIDSLMISSGCRRLSRLNIMHETLRLAARQLDKCGNSTPLSEKYYNANDPDSKDIGYRLKNEDVAAKMEEMLRDAIALLEEYPEGLRKSEALESLCRMIDDQSKMTEDGRILKAGSEISPESMQTPHDPGATYRKKAGKKNVGYVSNIVETCDGDKNLITDYDLQKNTYSDVQFAADVLNAMPDGGGETKKVTMDGAYGSTEILALAETKGVEIVTTSLLGGLQGTFEAEFEIDSDNIITKCPAGHRPIDARYSDGYYQAHFDAGTCMNCQYNDKCPGKYQKRAALTKFSGKALEKAKFAKELGTKEYWEFVKKRNGIEGVPSVLRRRYGIDYMRDKGLVRKRQRLGLKLMAINAGRLFKWQKEREISHAAEWIFSAILQLLFSFYFFVRISCNPAPRLAA
jgi:hypothetical protein